MKNLLRLIVLSALLSFLTNVARAQTASGGAYTLDQSAIASGGNSNSAGGTYTVAGTIGQTAAGSRSNASTFNAQNGFWTAAPLAPTAALVSIGGRVMTADGNGIRNATVTLTKTDGSSRTVLTGKFGAFSFVESEAGQTVIISVRAKRFTFAAPTQIVFAAENTNEINFVAAGLPVLQGNAILTGEQ